MHASSSLAILESFYGELISRPMVKKINSTPDDQLLELADRIMGAKTQRERNFFSSKEGSQWLHDGLFFEAGSPVGRWRSQTATCRLTEHESLKHVLLLAETVILHDSISEWACDVAHDVEYGTRDPDRAEKLSRVALEILPLVPMIRSGAVVLVDRLNLTVNEAVTNDVGEVLFPEESLVRVIESVYGHYFRIDNGPFYAHGDPYLSWVTMFGAGIVHPWELKDFAIRTIDDLLDSAASVMQTLGDETDESIRKRVELVRSAYPAARNFGDIHKAIGAAWLDRGSFVKTIAGSLESRRHLEFNARLLIEGPDRFQPRESRDDGISRLIRYRMPGVSGVTIDDIIRLRQQEDTYNELRTCVVELANQVEKSGTGESYVRFAYEVSERVETVVRPVYERLRQG